MDISGPEMLVDGGKIKAVSIPNGAIMNDTITGSKILNSTITANDLAANSVDYSEIKTDAVRADEIQANAVGVSEIATDAVRADEIQANAVGASEIATDAVRADEIQANAVGVSELANNAVDTLAVLDGNITSQKLAAAVWTAIGQYLNQAEGDGRYLKINEADTKYTTLTMDDDLIFTAVGDIIANAFAGTSFKGVVISQGSIEVGRDPGSGIGGDITITSGDGTTTDGDIILEALTGNTIIHDIPDTPSAMTDAVNANYVLAIAGTAGADLDNITNIIIGTGDLNIDSGKRGVIVAGRTETGGVITGGGDGDFVGGKVESGGIIESVDGAYGGGNIVHGYVRESGKIEADGVEGCFVGGLVGAGGLIGCSSGRGNIVYGLAGNNGKINMDSGYASVLLGGANNDAVVLMKNSGSSIGNMFGGYVEGATETNLMSSGFGSIGWGRNLKVTHDYAAVFGQNLSSTEDNSLRVRKLVADQVVADQVVADQVVADQVEVLDDLTVSGDIVGAANIELTHATPTIQSADVVVGGVGKSLTIRSGYNGSGDAGDLNIIGGNGGGSSVCAGADINITSGNGGSAANDGDIILEANDGNVIIHDIPDTPSDVQDAVNQTYVDNLSTIGTTQFITLTNALKQAGVF